MFWQARCLFTQENNSCFVLIRKNPVQSWPSGTHQQNSSLVWRKSSFLRNKQQATRFKGPNVPFANGRLLQNPLWFGVLRWVVLIKLVVVVVESHCSLCKYIVAFECGRQKHTRKLVQVSWPNRSESIRFHLIYYLFSTWNQNIRVRSQSKRWYDLLISNDHKKCCVCMIYIHSFTPQKWMQILNDNKNRENYNISMAKRSHHWNDVCKWMNEWICFFNQNSRLKFELFSKVQIAQDRSKPLELILLTNITGSLHSQASCKLLWKPKKSFQKNCVARKLVVCLLLWASLQATRGFQIRPHRLILNIFARLKKRCLSCQEPALNVI